MDDVCAHPIVASGHHHRAAERSRRRLYAWGIGINDADYGVYLPGTRGVIVLTM